MIELKQKIVFLTFFLGFCLLCPVLALPQSSVEIQEQKKATSIDIKSKTLELDNKLKVTTFSGDVKAKKEDFTIDCDKMLGYGVDMSNPETGEEKTTKISKIVAIGNVVIHRTDGGVATADQAEYYQKEEKIVLTGSPTVKQESDVVKGDRIIIFLKEDRIVVEDSNVTIGPRPETR